MTSPAEIVDALDGILYGDLFDCAPTLDEATRFSRLPITQDQLKAWLELPAVKSIVRHHDGFYFLTGRDEIVDLRMESLERARRFRKRASTVARCLQYVPFVRGVVLTGSVAVNDADEHADIDFLIIVAKRRLSLEFFCSVRSLDLHHCTCLVPIITFPRCIWRSPSVIIMSHVNSLRLRRWQALAPIYMEQTGGSTSIFRMLARLRPRSVRCLVAPRFSGFLSVRFADGSVTDLIACLRAFL